MNQKGFTFIELIAIVLVLAAICLVSFPTILNMTKQSDKNSYNEYKKTICLAGKTYLNNNNEIMQGKTSVDVSINELVNLGYLDEDLINPKTKLKVTEDKNNITVIVNSDKSLDCVYSE